MYLEFWNNLLYGKWLNHQEKCVSLENYTIIKKCYFKNLLVNKVTIFLNWFIYFFINQKTKRKLVSSLI